MKKRSMLAAVYWLREITKLLSDGIRFFQQWQTTHKLTVFGYA